MLKSGGLANRLHRRPSRASRSGRRLAQPADTLDRPGAGARGLDAFLAEMLMEEAGMDLVLVEALRRQHRGDDWDLGLELNLHEPADHRLGDEFMAIDAAIHHERGGHDGRMASAAGKQLGLERDLEGTGQLEEVDLRTAMAMGRALGEEGLAALVHELLVPAGLDEGDAWRRGNRLWRRR